jgi:putative ubiquitin-RnfH superfamily antitoxin RatB of RatAB toxin-antitoxin module
VFAKKVPADRVLEEGDRVELYRPLILDPMEARRRRAARGA